MTGSTSARSTQNLSSQVVTGLGRLDSHNGRMLLLLAVILLLTDIGYEGQRNPAGLPQLFLYSPASIFVFLVVFVTFSLFVRRIGSEAARAIGTVIVALLAATAKSVVLMILVHQHSFLANFLERIGGDLSIAAVYIVISAVIFHSYKNHVQIVEELNRVSARLTEQKQTTIEVASDVELELQEKANTALGPELDRIAAASEAILDEIEKSSLKMQIQALVRNQVRPLSREMNARVKVLKATSTPTIAKSTFKDLWKLRVIPRVDSSFIASYVVAIPNIFFTISSKAGLLNATLLLGVSLSYPVIGRIIQSALPRRKIPITYALNLPALASLVAYAPTGFFIYFLGIQYPLVGLTTFTAAGVFIFTCVAATAWFALQRTRDEFAEEILRVNSEIRHELDLLDQAIWVAQRKWSYIIHGTVQGALTVASSRLEMSTRPDEALKTAVRADIQRAKTVLVSPPTFDKPVHALFGEIADTWQGVCDFEYQISPSAELALSKSQTSVTCLIEITKELISNASRHGAASKFWLNVYLQPDGDLAIVTGNNGRLVPSGGRSGLGFEMISQVTKNWSLGSEKTNSFSATLPMPRD